jgi:hypothetical protein
LDRFKRHPFSERVARTLAHRTDPSSIVVHIHGAWGEGKTTVLAFIDQELQKFDHVVTVTFNPWRVTDQTALVLAFFNTIAAALDKAPKTLKEKIGDTLRQYGEIAGEFHLDVHGLKLTSGKALSRVGDLLSTITLEERRSRIEELLTKARTRIVVFLDDIDRLDRTEVQAVFKLLKLTANFINISFILAFDRDIVAHAIGTQFGAGNAQAGYEYLEKIIQVNLSLPVADPEALTKLCLDLLNTAIADARITLTAEQEKEFQLVFLQDIAPNLKTPRVAKLYANAVSFALPLFADELNPVDLLLLEALKCFHPTVHEHLRQNPGMYTGTFGWDMDLAINGNPECKAAIEFVINNQPATARHTQHLLTSLFPQLNELFHRGKYGSSNSDRAGREQRVRTDEYLKRYLTYGIPDGDISDKEVTAFLAAIPQMEPDAVEARYRTLLRADHELVLLLKLKNHLTEAPLATGEALCHVIARSGARLADQPADFSQLRSIAGLIIHDFAKRIDGAPRREFAATILQEAEPLAFAVACFGWMELQGDQHEAERLFSKTDADDLRDLLAERITQHAITTPLLAGRPSEFAPLLHTWQVSKGSVPVRRHLTECLSKRPEDVFLLVAPFANPSIVTREGYEALCRLVPPEEVLRALQATGMLDLQRTDWNARLAQTFQARHVEHTDAPPTEGAPSRSSEADP